MMWMHVLLTKRAFAREPLAWTLRVGLVIVLCCMTLSAWWVCNSVIWQQQITASSAAIDIVLAPEVDIADGSALANECVEQLRRRPDVSTVAALDRRSVWMQFQQELGLQSGGLTDIAAMPSVLQVSMKPEFVSHATAVAIRSAVLVSHRDIIDRVLIPDVALRGSDEMVHDARKVRVIIISALLFLVLCAFLIVYRAAATLIVVPSLNRVLGRSARWGALTAAIMTCVVALFGLSVSLLMIIVLQHQIRTHYVWLADFTRVLGA